MTTLLNKESIMHEVALTLSIISSLLFIVYLLIIILSPRQPQDNTITIRGSFLTRTIDTAGNSYTINRTIEHR